MKTNFTPEELAMDSLFFTRELETVLPRVYEARRAVPTARSLIPIISGISDRDADDIRFTSMSWVGDVGVGRVAWKNDGNVPVLSASRDEASIPVRSYKGAIQWEDRVLRRANSLGLGLETRGVEQLMMRFMLRENSLLWHGDTEQTGIYGVFTHPDVGSTALASGVAWDNGAVTAAQIYADLLQMARFIPSNTSLIYLEPPTLLLPWTAYQVASTKQFASGSDTTVLEYFRRNSGSLFRDIIPVRDLESEKKALVYIRDESIAGNVLVNDVYSYAPMRYSAGYSVDYQMDTGGFHVFDSNGIRKFTGILT